MACLWHSRLRHSAVLLSACALVLLSSCAHKVPSVEPILRSIAVTPANPIVSVGTTETFMATGTYSDSSTRNLTTAVTWNSQNANAATISANGAATAKAQGSSMISATLGSVVGSTLLTVNVATLVSIAVTAPTLSIAKGSTDQFTATGTYSDNSTQNLTGSITWSSQNAGTATITGGGLATGVGTGTSKIEAVSGAITGSATLTVTSATLVSIAVTAANLSIPKGTTDQFTATGTYSDNSTQNLTGSVTWSSQNTGAATITAGGLVTGVGTGMSKIQAVSGAVTGSTTLTVTAPTLVSIAVTAPTLSIAKGATDQFTATGTYSDNSTQNLTGSVTWSSQNTGVATITSGGLATGAGAGTSKIQATSGAISGSATLTVAPPTLVSIAVTAPTLSIAKGTTDQFTATGTYSDGSMQNVTNSVSWTSQSTGVATISTGGLATGVGAGTSKIQAASGSITGSANLTVTSATLVSIAVTAPTLSIAKGSTDQFTATGTYSDNSMQNITNSVTWSSQNTGVATITSGGLATGAGTGTSKIQASLGTIMGSATLTVTPPTLVSIAVTAPTLSIAKGTTDQFTATGTYSDNSTQNLTNSVTWASQSTNVATITAGGLATGVGTGTSKIQATLGSITGLATLTVTAPTLVSIAVTAPTLSIAKGTTDQFTATGTYSDNSMQNITNSVAWSSQSTGVATITSGGLATGAGTGTSKIQAASGAITGSATLTVTAAVLVSIAITPVNPTIGDGLTEQFTATGTYSDNSTENLTTMVTWSSSNTGIATISNTAGSNGLATAAASGSGSTTIQAALGSVQQSTTLTVTNGSATLQIIVVSPQNPSIADNSATQAFTATGHYSDGSTQNLTSTATWTSSNSSVASVNAAGVATSQPLASGVSAGFTSIKAAVGSTKGLSILSVTNHTSNSSGFAGVFTQHNDIARTGQNLGETILTPSNVNTSTFGKIFSQPVDGFVYAQPLYVPNVTIGGSKHNVIYVATEGDSVYAFDADSNTGTNGGLLWHQSMIDTAHGAAPGATTVNIEATLDSTCTDLIPQVGITSTPVIDPSTGTMYVEATSEENGAFIHRLHALDITTGAEKSPGPVQITASVPGTGDGSSGGVVSLDGLHHLNRPGLLWLNGTIYLGYASHCDDGPYHGWLIAYDAGTFTQTALLNTTPNGGLGGFWMSGAGVSADSNGNIFIASGNGDFDTTHVPAQELGDTVMKLFNAGSSTLSLVDYFTPWDQATFDQSDTDVGSGGVLLLPDQPGGVTHELVQAGKNGTIYLINRDQMTTNNEHYCQTNCNNMDPEITEEIQVPVSNNWLFSAPAYFNNIVYLCGAGDTLKAFPLSNGLLATTPSEVSAHPFNFPGATPVASANGSTNGIIWAIDSSQYGTPTSLGPAVLYAYQAGTLATLWTSSQSGTRDTAGDAVKFAVPTVANGKVYIGTQTELDVYGTLP